MEDHQTHPQYGIPQPSPHFSSDLFGFNLVSAPDQHHRLQFTDHEMGFLPRGVQGLTVAGNNSNTVAASTGGGGGGGFSGFTDGGETGRWPRQETLMLLEVRSRLDHKFKETNQKGPLWDEVSRSQLFTLTLFISFSISFHFFKNKISFLFSRVGNLS